MTQLYVAVITALLSGLVHASVLTPPVLPLTVRNPYMSAWLTDARREPWQKWPIFWTGQTMGMSLMASVANSSTVYPLLGRPQDSLTTNDNYNVTFPAYRGVQFDASTTTFTYEIPAPSPKDKAGRLTVSFLSPITPTSSLRQSIPASYISIVADSAFDIDIYMDVNGDWVSGDSNQNINWYLQSIDINQHDNLYSFQIQKEEEELLTEKDDRAEWGKLHFTGPSDANYQCGSSDIVRQSFAKNSKLSNNVEQNFRSIKDDEPVFAFHKKLMGQAGSSNKTHANNVLFTLTHIQDQIVQFQSARGLTMMRPLWKAWFSDVYSLLHFHYMDFHTAIKLAGEYSSRLEKDAYKSGGQDYVDIVALSARQVLGATTFSGIAEAPLIFLKEISSNGNTQTVDVIFPAFPFFTYTNPRWLAYLLEPLLEHQLSGQYPNKYSMHDLGAHFPNETGHADGQDEYMPVEECGDMLIMGLSLVNSLRYATADKAQSIWSTSGAREQPSGLDSSSTVFNLNPSRGCGEDFGIDEQWGGGLVGESHAKSWLERSYRLWKQWSDYLVDQALYPPNQLCTDDFAGWLPLQSNLALKGIVGIKAMSELALVMGNHDDYKFYKNVSEVYVEKWQELALTRDSDHAKLAYNWYGSWTTLYSLFADAVLCFHTEVSSQDDMLSPSMTGQKPLRENDEHNAKSSNFLPNDLYLNHSNFYTLAMQQYGLPLDSRHTYIKSDWMLQTAAVSTASLRASLNSALARWLNKTNTDLPFTDLFESEGNGEFGAGNRFAARPVVGSHFARLALERACGGKAVEGLTALDRL